MKEDIYLDGRGSFPGPTGFYTKRKRYFRYGKNRTQAFGFTTNAYYRQVMNDPSDYFHDDFTDNMYFDD